MSYNITSWGVKTLFLALPITFEFQKWLSTLPKFDENMNIKVGIDWCLDEGEDVLVSLVKQTWALIFIGDNKISGIIDNDEFVATDIACSGDFSGYIYDDVLIPLFEAFKGDMDAIIVWEGGDSIKHVTISEGRVSTEDIV